MYGKLLEQKKEAYDKGVQKIDNTITQVASLPVYREDDKKHLRDLVEGITTELNQQHGADWSDQHLNNITSKHISAIANDPRVQSNVASTMQAKSYMQKMKDDYETNGNKAVYNQKDGEAEIQSWLQNPDGMAKFNQDYFSYHDPVGDFGKFFKDKKPNSRVSVQYAGYHYDQNGNVMKDAKGRPVMDTKLAAQTWEAKIEKWKEISPIEVQQEWQEFIKTNPAYQKQLEINAKYTTTSPEEVLSLAVKTKTNEIQTQQRAIQEANLQMGLISAADPDREAKKRALQNDIHYYTAKLEDNEKLLDPKFLEKKRREFETDPSSMDKFKYSVYVDSLNDMIARRYSYVEDHDVKLEGMSPEQRKDKNETLEQGRQRIAIEQERLKIAQRHEQLWESAAAAKQRKAEGLDHASEYGANTKTKDNATEFTNQRDEKALNIVNSTNDYMFNTWGRKYADAFDVDENNKPHLKSVIPSPKTDKEKEINDAIFNVQELYNQQEDAFSGKTKMQLGPVTKNHFNSISMQHRLVDAMGNVLKQTNEAWVKKEQELIRTDPDLQRLFVEKQKYKDSIKASISSEEIQRIDNLNKADAEIYRIVGGDYTKLYSYKSKVDAIAKKYGFSDIDKLNNYKYGISSVHSAVSDYYIAGNHYEKQLNKIGSDEMEFKSNYLAANNYLVNQQYIPWLITEKSGKEVRPSDDLIVPLLHGVPSMLLQSKEAQGVGFVQDVGTGQFKMIIKGSRGKDEEFPITRQEAIDNGAPDLQTEDELSQLMRINKNRTGGTSSTTSKDWDDRSFSDAVPLTEKVLNGSLQDIRYHVKQESGQYYMELWVKDPNNENDKGHPYIDPTTKQILTATNSSLTNIRISLNNFARGNSLAVPAQYYDFSDRSYMSSDQNQDNNAGQ